MKNGVVIFVFVFVFVAGFVLAFGSSNFNVSSPTFSDGAGNIGSSNYFMDLVFGEIAGDLSSSVYDIHLGFWNAMSGSFDVTSPSVSINSPLAQNYSTSSISFNVTATDSTSGMSECWFSIDGGLTNNSLVNSTSFSVYNYTNSSVPDGQYVAEFYCNDSVGNVNGTESVEFGVDTVGPAQLGIILLSPGNNTNFTTSDVSFFVNVSDSGGLGIENVTIEVWNVDTDTLVFNATSVSNVWSDLSGTDTGDWMSTSIVLGVTYDSNNDLVYTIASSGKFGVYNRTSNIWSDLSGTDTGDWMSTSVVFGVTYDSNNDLVYTIAASGKFGVYNRTSNIWSDLSGTDTGDWMSTTYIFGVTYDSNNDLIYTVADSGKFGVYVHSLVGRDYNFFTTLSDGNYNWTVYAVDGTNFETFESETRVFGVSGNAAPSDPVVLLNSTDGSNKTLQDLNCLATIIDDNGDAMNVSVRWYKGGGLNLTVNYSNQANGTAFVGVLGFGNTTKGDVWKCGMLLYDGSEYSSWVNSSNLVILNSAPTVSLSSPADGSSTTDRTPSFSWTSNDNDGDSLTYEINISHLGGIGCVDLDEVGVGIGGQSYTPSVDLNCLYDNGDYYVWKVRASDVEVNGSWTGERKINISALVSVKLLTSSINFGNMNPGDSNDTATSALNPLKIENNGTVYVNISLNASPLWNMVTTNSSYYRFKVDNVTGEEGAFNWLSSIVDWFNIPFTGYVTSIDYLNYSDDKDSAEIDIAVEVPANEDPGVKSSNIILKAELAE